MNEIVNKFLLTGDKFMPEMHLKQPALTYSACGPFTKNKERIQKFKETRLGKVWFEHNIAHRDFKDVAKKTASDKV